MYFTMKHYLKMSETKLLHVDMLLYLAKILVILPILHVDLHLVTSDFSFQLRFQIVKRNKTILFFRVVMPVVFIIVGVSLQKMTTLGKPSVQQPLVLSPHLYAGQDRPNATYQLSFPGRCTKASVVAKQEFSSFLGYSG